VIARESQLAHGIAFMGTDRFNAESEMSGYPVRLEPLFNGRQNLEFSRGQYRQAVRGFIRGAVYVFFEHRINQLQHDVGVVAVFDGVGFMQTA